MACVHITLARPHSSIKEPRYSKYLAAYYQKMELCTLRTISNLPHHRLFSAGHSDLRWNTSLPLKQTSTPRTNRGSLYYTNSSLRSTTSEETSSGASQYVGEEPGSVITVEDVQSVEKNSYGEMQKEVPKEDFSMDEQSQIFDFLDKLGIKLDSEDSYSIILFGGGALSALWLATAVVGAIDSIPVFPKLMEVVGLAYTLWFSSRYLIYKKNRDELAAKIEEIKQQVLGSIDD
uniref:Cyanobacterial aminoacyl-tRNA synthetase CAAD domain-containing protein n=1 Tax=Davidia involucrata TaxID=16924 RepID=A0A5B7B053_DAVIN